MDDNKRGPKRTGGFGGNRGPRKEGGFKPREEGGYKPRAPRGDSEGGERPRRSYGDRPSFGEKRPYTPRGEGGYKPREGGYAPRRPREDGEGGERPRRSYGDRPQFGEKRPYTPRGEGGYKPRGEGGYKPREGGYKPRGEGYAPRRPREDGEGAERPRRSYGDKPQFGEKRPYTPRGPRTEGGYQSRGPRREGGYGDREGGFKPRYQPREEGNEGFNRKPKMETHWVEKDPYANAPQSDGWLVGKHAVTAAITAGRRTVKEVWMAAEEGEIAAFAAQFPQVKVKTVARKELEERFPGQVHQGMAAEVGNLPQPELSEILAEQPRLLVALDQVTDPHNFGAILRSCAAFGVGGVVATERRSAGVTSVVAKAAAGALETVPVVEVTNLVTSLKAMQEAGYTVIGLDGEATQTLAEAIKKPDAKVCVVMGSEGEGLRRLTRESCDALVRIPMGKAMESLNVSVAAGIILSQLFKA